jgi:threonine/homoserine/homoserine lactone efflux protein
VKKHITLFAIAAAISSMGALPLGTLNLMASHISVIKGTGAGFAFAWGVLLVEMVYVFLTLQMFQLLAAKKQWLFNLRWFSAGILLILGLWLLFWESNASLPPVDKGLNKNPFLSGLILSALNPAQIPFWLGWITVAQNKKWLDMNPVNMLIWLLGIGTGTFLGLGLFIWGGAAIAGWLLGNNHLLNNLLGWILTGTGIFQIALIMAKKK